ncbi:uncharacterized protein LOC131222527 isoform X6 [Magnolia sinica]|uniref:uncharacterized protein LOC131222527 isoform X6 n=1 Tax=Magnolia sinica TaxID=86752 RepID=UPI0026580AB0|nr:uncharacterized protein LOC131222527 isoform X6 [Magnolia sinica]
MPEIPSSASKSPAARGSRQQHYSKKKKPADASQLPAISTREKSRILRAESVFAPESTSRRSSTRCSILTSSADQSDFTRGIGGGIWVKIL